MHVKRYTGDQEGIRWNAIIVSGAGAEVPTAHQAVPTAPHGAWHGFRAVETPTPAHSFRASRPNQLAVFFRLGFPVARDGMRGQPPHPAHTRIPHPRLLQDLHQRELPYGHMTDRTGCGI